VFTGGVLVAAMVISVLAIISKLIGCGLPLIKEGMPTMLRVGVGMIPRGEVALIVALVGLQSKIVTQSTYAIVVFMTGVTTLIAPPVMRYLFRDEMPEAAEETSPAAHAHL
jgi:Kef-type K+ transport system membrane component KefB